jgi:phage baseplate assembly protein W
MANLLKRFNKYARGTADTDVDFLPKIAPSGDFERVTNINAILNSWNNILLTPKRSYPYDPEYGSDLYKLVFEPRDDITAERIEQEVVGVLQRYDNRAEIESINISYLRNNAKGFKIDLVVEYEGETESLSVTITEGVFSGFLTVED